MIAAPLLLALAAQPAHLLILGGGKSPADAAAAKSKLRVPKSVTPADGYPRVVKSDDIQGLKPGFHIVVLGACAPDEWRLDAMRTMFDGSYVRAIEWKDGAVPCPKLAEKWKLGPPAAHTIAGEKLTVRRSGSDVLVVARRDRKGPGSRVVVTPKQLERFGQVGCSIGEKGRVVKRSLVVDFVCWVPDCTTQGTQEGEIWITPRKKALRVDLEKGKYTPGECD